MASRFIMLALVRAISPEWQKLSLMRVDLRKNEKKERKYRNLFQEVLMEREERKKPITGGWK